MKLTSTQLRNIIREEVARVARGRLSEGVGAPGPSASGFANDAAVSWETAYDPADPVMGAGGPEAWDAQVEAARVELEEGLEALLSQVEDKLYGGEYA